MGYGLNPLSLSHNGSDWHGTFGVALRALLDDVLTDGPVDVVLMVVQDEQGTAGRRSGRLVGRTADTLLLDDGSPVSIEDVVAVEIP